MGGTVGSLSLFPFQVRRLTLGKKGKPIFADCFLSFIPKVVEGYERVVLFIKISCGGFHSLESLSAISDVPVVLASTRGSVCACTNNLCRGKKTPAFIVDRHPSYYNHFFPAYMGSMLLVDPVNMPSAEELKCLEEECDSLVVLKDGCLNLFSERLPVMDRVRILFHKDLNCFATKDYFAQETIKNGRVAWKDFSDSERQLLQKQTRRWSACMVLKLHNENDFSICFRFRSDVFLIEPHGVRSVFYEPTHNYTCCLNPCLKQPNDTWMDKVWIECPNGKSPKMCYCIEDNMRVEHNLKRNKVTIIKDCKIVEEKSIWENEIKNEIKEEPKQKKQKESKKQEEEKKEAKKSKKDPFEIKKDEIKKNEKDPFEED